MQTEIVGISVIPVTVIISKQPRGSPKLQARQTTYEDIYISFIKG